MTCVANYYLGTLRLLKRFLLVLFYFIASLLKHIILLVPNTINSKDKYIQMNDNCDTLNGQYVAHMVSMGSLHKNLNVECLSIIDYM